MLDTNRMIASVAVLFIKLKTSRMFGFALKYKLVNILSPKIGILGRQYIEKNLRNVMNLRLALAELIGNVLKSHLNMENPHGNANL